MNRNKVLIALLVALLACLLVLTACDGTDVTTDTGTPSATPTAEPTATPESSATPVPLMSMDGTERTWLLYQRYLDYEYKSYNADAEMSVNWTLGDGNQSITSKGTYTVFDYKGDNYTCYFVADSALNGEKFVEESGFVNGVQFRRGQGGVAMYSKISAQDYIAQKENENATAAINPTAENCENVSSVINSDGTWTVAFSGYTDEVSNQIFEDYFSGILGLYGFAIDYIDVQYILTVEADGRPISEYINIAAMPFLGYNIRFNVNVRSTYADIDAVTEAPVVDLAQYIEVPDVDIFEDVSDNLREYMYGDGGKYTMQAVVGIAAPTDYSISNTETVTFKREAGLLNLDSNYQVGVSYQGQNFFSDAQVKYDGRTFTTVSGGQEESTQESEDVVVSYFLSFLNECAPSYADVTTFTKEDTDSGVTYKFQGASNVAEEYMSESLSSLLDGEWYSTDSSISYVVKMDKDGNVTAIEQHATMTVEIEGYQFVTTLESSLNIER